MPTPQHASLDAFFAALDAALAPVLHAVRHEILADPTVTEALKWNCASFRGTEDFATLNIRPVKGKPHVVLVLHTGAKVIPREARIAVTDPDGILQWLGFDRAVVNIADGPHLQRMLPGLRAVLASWPKRAV